MLWSTRPIRPSYHWKNKLRQGAKDTRVVTAWHCAREVMYWPGMLAGISHETPLTPFKYDLIPCRGIPLSSSNVNPVSAWVLIMTICAASFRWLLVALFANKSWSKVYYDKTSEEKTPLLSGKFVYSFGEVLKRCLTVVSWSQRRMDWWHWQFFSKDCIVCCFINQSSEFLTIMN